MTSIVCALALAAMMAWSIREARREEYDRQKLRENTAKLFLTVQEFNRVFTAYGDEHRPQFSIAVLRELVGKIDTIEGMTLDQAERACHAGNA